MVKETIFVKYLYTMNSVNITIATIIEGIKISILIMVGIRLAATSTRTCVLKQALT